MSACLSARSSSNIHPTCALQKATNSHKQRQTSARSTTRSGPSSRRSPSTSRLQKVLASIGATRGGEWSHQLRPSSGDGITRPYPGGCR